MYPDPAGCTLTGMRSRLVVLLALALALGACGGGESTTPGGGSGTAAPATGITKIHDKEQAELVEAALTAAARAKPAAKRKSS